MKSLIVAAALAVSTMALADVGKPFEQLDLDRALPPIPDNVAAYEPIPRERLPFEQTQLDRGDFSQPERVQVVQMGNSSYKSDAGAEESPWANDHNFIAPAP